MVTLMSLEHKERFSEFNLKSQNDRLDSVLWYNWRKAGELENYIPKEGGGDVSKMILNKEMI